MHQSDACSQISNIPVQRSRSRERSLTWLGGTHKAALQWWSHTHAHTPASAHAIRAESVSPQCDPCCAAGALCMNCYRPRSHWGIIWEPLPSPHTCNLTHTQTLCPQCSLIKGFSPSQLFYTFIHFLSPPLLCFPLFHPLLSTSICFSSILSLSHQHSLSKLPSGSPSHPPSLHLPSPSLSPSLPALLLFFILPLLSCFFPHLPLPPPLHSCAEAD